MPSCPAQVLRRPCGHRLADRQGSTRLIGQLYRVEETIKGLSPDHGHDPQLNLADVLIRIADHPAWQIAELLPCGGNPLVLTAPLPTEPLQKHRLVIMI
jgi:hypothetical protein